MKRIYTTIIQEHLAQFRQMVFLSGPRQTGKTTLSQLCATDYFSHYFNWDNVNDRELILSGIDKIAQTLQSDVLTSSEKMPVIILDEIHKYTDWKSFLKGAFDVIETDDKIADCKIIVTGSAKLNVFRRGGDSMMGRYFLYRIHPLSVTEIVERSQFEQETVSPKAISDEAWENLLQFGGFPEPYLHANARFYQRWQKLKQEQLFEEDLREISKIYQINRIELLSQLLIRQAGNLTQYSELAKKVRVSEPTIRNWMSVLENLYYHFSISPWSENIARSLLKEPKVYLWDWSLVQDVGAKIENLVAAHLLKAVHFWTDIGLGDYQLYYLRDKEKREVDFLVTKNKKPWLMVEVKNACSGHLSPHLHHFNRQLSVPHVMQVAADLPFIDEDCFALTMPKIVPLRTFLSQLV